MAARCAADDVHREELGTWWAVVWPMWASAACVLLMNCTDLAILGHYRGGKYLPAASSASVVISFTTCIIARGPCGTIATLSANAHGAGQSELGGRRLQMALAYTTILSLAVSPLWAFAGECMLLLSRSDVSLADVDTFGRWRLVGILPSSWYLVLQAWLSGRAQTRPALYTSAMASLLNVLLNYVLIYGMCGWGGLGFVGSPVATSLSNWVMLLGLLCWSRREISRCWPAAAPPSFERLRREDFMKLCVPLTVAGALEEFNMQLTAIFALALGPEELATHDCMLTAYFFLSSAMSSFASGTSARVSHHLVRGHLAKIRRLSHVAGAAMFSWSFVVMVAFIVLQERIGQLFSDNAEVWTLSGQLSILVGLLYFLIAAFYLAMGVLEGIARPTVIMVGFVFGCYVVGLPLSYFLGFVAPPEAFAWWPYFDPKTASGERSTGCGLLGLWIGLAAGYFATSTVVIGRLLCMRDWSDMVSRARQLAELGPKHEPLVHTRAETAQPSH